MLLRASIDPTSDESCITARQSNPSNVGRGAVHFWSLTGRIANLNRVEKADVSARSPNIPAGLQTYIQSQNGPTTGINPGNIESRINIIIVFHAPNHPRTTKSALGRSITDTGSA